MDQLNTPFRGFVQMKGAGVDGEAYRIIRADGQEVIEDDGTRFCLECCSVPM